MPAAIRRDWSIAEVRALIEAEPLQTPRYELVDGELFVTPSPNGLHQYAVAELLAALKAWLAGAAIGDALASPFDVELETGTIVQPDIFVVPPDEGRRVRRELPARVLLLAVEVISPSSARGDRGRKRALYQRRVAEYWVVDVDAELIERWRPGEDRPEILRETIQWQPEGASVAFVLDLPKYFARVAGRAP